MSDSIPSSRRSRAPAGVQKTPVGMRLKPDEHRALSQDAREQRMTDGAFARCIYLRGHLEWELAGRPPLQALGA